MSEMWPEQREHLAPEDRHEGPDFSVRGLLIAAAGLVLLVAAALFGAAFFTPSDRQVSAGRHPIAPERIDEPPDPRITRSHRDERRQLERRVEERLSTYGWIDRDEGVARIPVDRAVELVLDQGLPARTSPDDARVNVPPAGIRPADDRQPDSRQKRQPNDD